MAFKQISGGFAESIKIGNGKDGTRKQVTGWLMGCKTGIGEYDSVKYSFAPTTGGKIFEVWGNGSINFLLLSEAGKLKKEFSEKLIRITFDKTIPAKKKGRSPTCACIVEVDDSAKVPKGVGRIKF